MKENSRALLFTAIAVASWSTVASAFKIGLRHYSNFELILVSAITAMLILAVVITFQKKWRLLKKLTKEEFRSYAFIGLLNPAFYYLILFKSYDLLPAQIAQPINFFWPILLTILLAVIEKERIPAFKFIGMVISFGGVVLISVGPESIAGVQLSKVGILLAFFSAFLWATFWIVNRRNKNVDGVLGLFLSFTFGSLYLLLGSLFVPVNLDSLPGLLSSIYAGMFEMAVPFIFFRLALQKTTNPALANQLCLLSPFISLFIIHLVLGETIYFTTYIGLFLIIFGILLNEFLSKRKIVTI
ncbi:MAG: DMT family transporter [Petrimonas sp.]|jgi:drug/metabolite transporter (DMT)-like permease